VNQLAHVLGTLFATAVLLPAQQDPQARPPSDEFLKLEPVLQAALQKAAPFVVTVETFGGTRRREGKDGELDGDGPPKPREVPVEKAEPEPEFTPPALPEGRAPWTPEELEKLKKEFDEQTKRRLDEEKAKKAKKPLVAGGFAQTQGKTTGVVLTADGWIVVSRFALALEPTTVLITVPGRGTFHAERAGEDTSRGIGLVKIDAEGLPVPEFVHPDKVAVGQWAFALGRTFAADEPTVHLGIVSAKRRQFGRALQIDAYTSPANYGGACVDVHGRVLGIAVPLSPTGRNAGVEWYDSGIGFAVTIADIWPLLARMQQGQVLQRGWLGVQFVTSHLGPGAKIERVVDTGAAAKAGLAAGDVLLQADGVDVINGPHFMMLVSSRLGGDLVTLAVKRKDGTTATVGPITLLDAPWSEQRQNKEAELPATFPLPEKPEGR
jgi:S1-C subfamily serine protease